MGSKPKNVSNFNQSGGGSYDSSGGGSSNSSGTNQTNNSFSSSYGLSPERSSGDISNLRNLVGQGVPRNQETDYAYGNQINRINNSFGNVTSAYGTPELDAQRKLEATEQATSDYAKQKSVENANRYQQNVGNSMNLASLTAPQIVQMGGQSQGNNFFNQQGSNLYNQMGGYNNTMTGGGTQGQSGGFLGGLLSGFL